MQELITNYKCDKKTLSAAKYFNIIQEIDTTSTQCCNLTENKNYYLTLLNHYNVVNKLFNKVDILHKIISSIEFETLFYMCLVINRLNTILLYLYKNHL